MMADGTESRDAPVMSLGLSMSACVCAKRWQSTGGLKGVCVKVLRCR